MVRVPGKAEPSIGPNARDETTIDFVSVGSIPSIAIGSGLDSNPFATIWEPEGMRSVIEAPKERTSVAGAASPLR